ncbi:hypothetical protein BASA81_004213 [Batrachochytrium salamandrivorans]|nr:hypothetical protein BASA81_004213 [Batrachochytrium salamandrivorans]
MFGRAVRFTYGALALIPATLTVGSGFHYLNGQEHQARAWALWAWSGWTAIPYSVLLFAFTPHSLLFDPVDRKSLDWVQRSWARATLYPFVQFDRPTPAAAGKRIVVSNHQSALDILILLACFEDLHFVSKQEVFYIPLVGWVMGLIGHVGLTRGDKLSGKSALESCERKLREGVNWSVVFFAEGSRGAAATTMTGGGKLGEFKVGAFKLAAASGVDILPVTIINSGKAMPPGRELSFLDSSVVVQVKLHDSISVQTAGGNVAQLQQQCRQAVASGLSSLRVFRKFIVRHPNPSTGVDVLDASGVISSECFAHWVSTRKRVMNSMEKAFQRSLSAHLTASDGRSPFTPSEEFAILKVVRKKQRWPCFPETETKYGAMGFRFHEKQWEETNKGQRWTPDVLPIPATVNAANRKKVRFSTRSGAKRRGGSSNSKEGEEDDEDDDDAGESASSGTPAVASLDLVEIYLTLSSDLLTKHKAMTVATEVNGGFAPADVWSTILSLGRMHLFAQSWSVPKLHDAQAVLQLYMERFPQSLLLVCNLTCREAEGRVLCMSPSAQLAFGNTSAAAYGDFITQESDKWNALNCIVRAVQQPRTEQLVSVRLGLNRAAFPGTLCALYMCAFPQERVLVIRAL